MSSTQPAKTGLSRTTGHLLSVLIIGIAMITVVAVAESKGDGGFWMYVFAMSAVAAMSWHAFVLGISTAGINIKQSGNGSTTE